MKISNFNSFNESQKFDENITKINDIIEKHYDKRLFYPLNALFDPDDVDIKFWLNEQIKEVFNDIRKRLGSEYIEFIDVDYTKEAIKDERIANYKNRMFVIGGKYYFICQKDKSLRNGGETAESVVKQLCYYIEDAEYFEKLGGIKVLDMEQYY